MRNLALWGIMPGMAESRNSRAFQWLATIFVAVGVALTVMRILLGLQAVEPVVPLLWSAVVFALIGVGLGVIAVGVSLVLSRVRHISEQAPEGVEPIRQAIEQLRGELATLRVTGVEAAPAGSATVESDADRLNSDVPLNDGDEDDAEEDSAPATVTSTSEEPAFRHVMQMLEEIREIAAMSDDQRRQMLADQSDNHKEAILRQVDDAVQQREWARASRILIRLQAQHPNDPDVEQAKQRVADENRAHENDALTNAIHQVEALMAVAAWDQALDRAGRFTEDFPHNDEGFALLQRVRTERIAYRNQTAQALFAQIKQFIEHRQWRKALAASERLIERFSDHPRAERVRVQLSLIRENAEIEQRHEMEGRLKDLIRGRQYHHAMLVAEELLQRYPDSRQADLLEELLPKLRQRAMEDELFSSEEVPEDEA